MREIKFRAWNNIYKWYDYEAQSIYDLMIDDSFQNVLDNGNLIVEEFTGIKDKNGVEIYENDIIQYGSDEDFRFIVIFKYGCFYAHNILGNEFMLDCLLGSLLMSKKVGVIGNIHESSDLLEGRKTCITTNCFKKKNDNQPKTLDELIAGYKDDGCHETELDWGESKGEEL